jgi:hypothetical protein
MEVNYTCFEKYPQENNLSRIAKSISSSQQSLSTIFRSMQNLHVSELSDLLDVLELPSEITVFNAFLPASTIKDARDAYSYLRKHIAHKFQEKERGNLSIFRYIMDETGSKFDLPEHEQCLGVISGNLQFCAGLYGESEFLGNSSLSERAKRSVLSYSIDQYVGALESYNAGKRNGEVSSFCNIISSKLSSLKKPESFK